MHATDRTLQSIRRAEDSGATAMRFSLFASFFFFCISRPIFPEASRCRELEEALLSLRARPNCCRSAATIRKGRAGQTMRASVQWPPGSARIMREQAVGRGKLAKAEGARGRLLVVGCAGAVASRYDAEQKSNEIFLFPCPLVVISRAQRRIHLGASRGTGKKEMTFGDFLSSRPWNRSVGQQGKRSGYQHRPGCSAQRRLKASIGGCLLVPSPRTGREGTEATRHIGGSAWIACLHGCAQSFFFFGVSSNARLARARASQRKRLKGEPPSDCAAVLRCCAVLDSGWMDEVSSFRRAASTTNGAGSSRSQSRSRFTDGRDGRDGRRRTELQA